MSIKERAQQEVQSLMREMSSELPPLVQSMLPLFSTQFLQRFDSVTDEQIILVLGEIRKKLDYIENGEA